MSKPRPRVHVAVLHTCVSFDAIIYPAKRESPRLSRCIPHRANAVSFLHMRNHFIASFVSRYILLSWDCSSKFIFFPPDRNFVIENIDARGAVWNWCKYFSRLDILISVFFFFLIWWRKMHNDATRMSCYINFVNFPSNGPRNRIKYLYDEESQREKIPHEYEWTTRSKNVMQAYEWI